MSKFSIYSKDGSIIRYAGEPKYTGTFMGVSYIEFSSIDSPVPIPWERGDYVDYYRIGKRFRLYSRPEPKKQARRGESGASFIYSNVKFYASTKDLEIAPFRDLVPADNDIHFSTRPDVSTYESVYGIAARIQECMDDIFPGKWAIEVFDTSDTDLLALFNEQKEFSVSNGSCLGALSQIYEVWKNVGWVHTYDSVRDKEIITIGRTSLRDSENTSDSYAYGIGNGLTSLKKAAANEDEFATRLYVYGSERNIQTRYYNGLNIHDKDSVNIVNLMLPPEKWGKTNGLPDARKAYLQADDALIEKYGLIPRTVYFDGNENEEIYPSITGLTCADVRAEMLASGVPANRPNLPPDNSERIDLVVSAYGWTTGDKEETEKYPTFDMHLRQMGFNIAEQGKLTSEGMATISMKSGACAGREFKVKSYALDKNNQPYLSVEKSWDDSLGMSFPNGLYPIVAGDQFVLLDIPMPDYYITLAQKRLLEAGEKLLSDYTRVSPLYEPSVDSFKVKKGTKILQEGMYMQVYDKDIIDTEDNRDYILIDSLSIDEKGDLPTYKVTLREQKRSGRTFGTLEGMIEDAKKSTDDEIKRQRIYTDRRFRSAQETISMLQEAFDGYTEGINPVTIETMSLLVGNEALQFKFTATRDSLSAVPCPLSYNNDTKQLSSVPASLIHLTLGIDAITTQSMPAGSYMSWDMPEWYSAQLDDPSKQYYVYAKVSVTAGGEATYLLSETAIGMSEVEGYYHLLIGIINSEYVGARDFVTVYGFTEVLPGQITTDIIRDADSNLIIDLLNATITAKNGAKIIGDVEFGTNSTGLSNLSEWRSLESEVGSLGVSVQKASRPNLLANSAEAIVPAIEDDNYNYLAFPLPIGVSTGDTFTFKAEKADTLIGDFTQFTLRLMNTARTEDYSAYNTKVDVGENVTVTLTVTKQGLTNAPAVLLIYAGLIDNTAGKSLRVEHFSLVKGTTAMPIWQDYQGDNGLKNLINRCPSDSATIVGESAYSHWDMVHITVNGGEVYSFMAEYASVTNDTGFNIGLHDSVNNKWVNTETWPIYIEQGNYVTGLLKVAKSITLNDGTVQDVINKEVRLLVYAGQTPATGKTLRLINFSLVKGTRPMMVWKANTDYLTNAFKNGSTKISGGLTMTQAVMVEDESGTVRGMLNGSNYAKDSTHGRLILAAGSEGSSEAQLRAAKTRIFEDGHLASKSATIEGDITANSGQIGCANISTDGALKIDTSSVDGQMVLSESGLSFISSSKGVTVAQCSSGLVNVCADTLPYCVTASHNIGLRVRSNDAAIYSDNGMYYGLRPRTRYVSSGDTLTELDHNVFITGGTISLPSLPLKGQTYKIYHTSTTSLTINGNGKTIKQMRGDKFQDGPTAISSQIEVIELLWSGSYWYATLNRWD